MTASVGVSDNSDLPTAVGLAAKEALAACTDASAVLLFITHSYGRSEFESGIAALVEATPSVRQRAAGMVNGLAFGAERYDAMFNRRAVAVVAFGAAWSPVMALSDDARPDPEGAGRAVVEQAARLLGREPRRGLLLTPGLGVGAPLIDQRILDGMHEVAPELRVAGTGLTTGMKVDGLAEPALAYLDGRAVEHAALLVAFSDKVRADCALANGARASGGSFRLTEVSGNVWKKAGSQNARDAALDLLAGDDPERRAHFLVNPAIASAEHSVCLGSSAGEDFHWCEPPIAFTDDGAAIAFYPLAPGAELSRVRLDSDCAIGAVEEAVTQLHAQSGSDSYEFVLSFSCTMRGFTLGQRAAEETPLLLNKLHPKAHLTVVANGEIGCRQGGRPRATVWAFSVCGLGAR